MIEADIKQPEGEEIDGGKGEKRRTRGRRAGQVIRRGERKFLIRIPMGKDAAGRRLIFNKTIHGTKKEAETWAGRAMGRVSRGEPIEDGSRTMGEWLDEWLAAKAHTIRPRSLEIYRENVKRHIRPALGGFKLAAISAADVDTFYRGLTEKGLSGKTISLVHTILTNIFRVAIKKDILRKSPMPAVDPPRVIQKEQPAMTADQARAFLAAADQGPEGCAFAFLLGTGCRPGEAQGLKWSDVNFEAGTVTIQRNLVRLDGARWQFGEPKTAKGRRTIPLPAGLLKRLADHRRRQAEARLKAGPGWAGLDLVFCNVIGEPHRADYLSTEWKRALDRAGLPASFRLYDARHTAATLLMASGLSPKIASERLGHANVNITLNIYSHVLPGMQEEASAVLDRAIFG